MGLLTDEDEALKWYREAAKGGNGYAQRRLGVAYEKGEFGVEIDLAAARAFYQAAESADHKAQWRLGMAYEDELARLLRELQVGYDFSMGVPLGTAI